MDYTNLPNGSYQFIMRVSDPVSGMEAKFSFPISKGKNVFLSKTGSVLMDLFAVLFMVGILVYTSLYRKRGRLEDKLFFGMVLVNMTLSVSNGVSCLLEENTGPGIRELIIAGNIVFFLLLANLENRWIFSIGRDSLYERGPYNFVIIFVPAFFYLLLTLIRLYKIGWRDVFLLVILVFVRVMWGLWFRDISSTSFIFALLLACIHFDVAKQQLVEENL